jgi:hypothetical protein
MFCTSLDNSLKTFESQKGFKKPAENIAHVSNRWPALWLLYSMNDVQVSALPQNGDSKL